MKLNTEKLKQIILLSVKDYKWSLSSIYVGKISLKKMNYQNILTKCNKIFIYIFKFYIKIYFSTIMK